MSQQQKLYDFFAKEPSPIKRGSKSFVEKSFLDESDSMSAGDENKDKEDQISFHSFKIVKGHSFSDLKSVIQKKNFLQKEIQPFSKNNGSKEGQDSDSWQMDGMDKSVEIKRVKEEEVFFFDNEAENPVLSLEKTKSTNCLAPNQSSLFLKPDKKVPQINSHQNLTTEIQNKQIQPFLEVPKKQTVRKRSREFNFIQPKAQLEAPSNSFQDFNPVKSLFPNPKNLPNLQLSDKTLLKQFSDSQGGKKLISNPIDCYFKNLCIVNNKVALAKS